MLALALVAAPKAAAAAPVTATIPAGGKPEVVAVNPDTGDVYVANFASDTASVINGRTSTVTATIRVGIGASPEGVAVNPDTGAVYVAASGSGVVWVVSGRTNTATATIRVGSGPTGVDEHLGEARAMMCV